MRKIPFEILNFFGFIPSNNGEKKSTNRREFRSNSVYSFNQCVELKWFRNDITIFYNLRSRKVSKDERKIFSFLPTTWYSCLGITIIITASWENSDLGISTEAMKNVEWVGGIGNSLFNEGKTGVGRLAGFLLSRHRYEMRRTVTALRYFGAAVTFLLRRFACTQRRRRFHVVVCVGTSGQRAKRTSAR